MIGKLISERNLQRGPPACGQRRARQFIESVNRHGGDAIMVFLPDIGLRGNTHFTFADLNNIEIADQLEAFLHSKSLDKTATRTRDRAEGPWKLQCS